MKQLQSILLIDDNKADNYYHEIIISELNITNEIMAIQNPKDGLDYLLSLRDKGEMLPDLIFIDLNMPMMNGFDLLESFFNEFPTMTKKPVIVMLSTSLNPADQKRTEEFEEIAMYANKPLTTELLNNIINNYFV